MGSGNHFKGESRSDVTGIKVLMGLWATCSGHLQVAISSIWWWFALLQNNSASRHYYLGAMRTRRICRGGLAGGPHKVLGGGNTHPPTAFHPPQASTTSLQPPHIFPFLPRLVSAEGPYKPELGHDPSLAKPPRLISLELKPQPRSL